jgi:hypothetical protein
LGRRAQWCQSGRRVNGVIRVGEHNVVSRTGEHKVFGRVEEHNNVSSVGQHNGVGRTRQHQAAVGPSIALCIPLADRSVYGEELMQKLK